MPLSDLSPLPLPAAYPKLWEATVAAGFGMPSDRQTGALLRTLVASKPGGRILELGTGTGLGAAWLLDGMDADARLDSVELDEACQGLAREHLGTDPRVTFHGGDGLAFLEAQADARYDLIYADTWPGKYVGFEHTLRILKRGGMVVLDDMLPQPNWPADHPPKVEALLATLASLSAAEYVIVHQCWYTGHILIVKR